MRVAFLAAVYHFLHFERYIQSAFTRPRNGKIDAAQNSERQIRPWRILTHASNNLLLVSSNQDVQTTVLRPRFWFASLKDVDVTVARK